MIKVSFSYNIVEKVWIVQNLENVKAVSDVKTVLSWFYPCLPNVMKWVRASLVITKACETFNFHSWVKAAINKIYFSVFLVHIFVCMKIILTRLL